MGEPRPTMRATSPTGRGAQPYSPSVRLSARAISEAVSNSVPSRSNSTALIGRPRQAAVECVLDIDGHAHRTMIASHDLRMNSHCLDGFAQARGHQEVVDSPTDVAGTRIGEMAPPRIVTVPLREQPEGVDEPCIDQILKALALFVRKPLLAAIRLWIGKIEFRMRHVEITAQNEGLFRL